MGTGSGSTKKEEDLFVRLLPVGIIILKRFKILRIVCRFGQFRSVPWHIKELYGERGMEYHIKTHQANKVLHATLGLVLAGFLGLAAGKIDIIFMGFMGVLVAGLFFLPDYELGKRVKRRRLLLQIEFPEFINKITLLISAGMTVQQAIEKIVRDNKRISPLYQELSACLIDIRSGKPIYLSYENFARRCGIPEITKFIAVILQNMKRGNAELVYVLRIQGHECWEMRKHAARRLGEEASTKLLFPLMLMLTAIMIITASPAVLALKSIM